MPLSAVPTLVFPFSSLSLDFLSHSGPPSHSTPPLCRKAQAGRACVRVCTRVCACTCVWVCRQDAGGTCTVSWMDLLW